MSSSFLSICEANYVIALCYVMLCYAWIQPVDSIYNSAVNYLENFNLTFLSKIKYYALNDIQPNLQWLARNNLIFSQILQSQGREPLCRRHS